MPKPRPAVDRILERTAADPDSGCWIWQGAVNAGGYGRVSVGSRAEGTLRQEFIHRAVYEALVAPIPEGLHIDHLCRVRHCVNPEHMDPVPKAVNTLRGEAPAARNARKTHCDNDHPLEGDNLRVTRAGHRQCRTCFRASQKRHRQRHRAQISKVHCEVDRELFAAVKAKAAERGETIREVVRAAFDEYVAADRMCD